MRSRAAVAVFLFGAGAFWNGGNVGPVAAQLSNRFSVSLGSVGLLSGTAFFVVLVLFSLTVAPATRAIGAALTARIGCLLGAAGNVALALAPAFWVLLVGRAIVGVGVALALVIGPAIARAEGGVRFISVFGASVMFGVAAALGLGGLLVAAGASWRLTFVISAAIAVAALPLLPARIEVRPPGHFPPGIVRRMIESGPELRLLLLFAAALGIPLVISAWLNHYLATSGGIAPGLAGVLAFSMFAISTAIRIASGRLAAGGASPILLAGAAPLAAALGVAVVAVEPALSGAIPGIALMGVGFALPYAVMYDEAERLFPAAPVASLSYLSSGANLIPIFAIPLLGSALEHGDAEPALLAMAAFVAVAGIANLRPALRRGRSGGRRT